MVETKEEKQKGEDKEEEEGEIVRIKVTLRTRERLKMLGIKGDSYDDIINVMFGELAR